MLSNEAHDALTKAKPSFTLEQERCHGTDGMVKSLLVREEQQTLRHLKMVTQLFRTTTPDVICFHFSALSYCCIQAGSIRICRKWFLSLAAPFCKHALPSFVPRHTSLPEREFSVSAHLLSSWLVRDCVTEKQG